MLSNNGWLLKIVVLWLFSGLAGPTETRQTARPAEIETCDRIDLAALELRAAEGLYYYQNEPFTGQAFVMYPSRRVAEEKDFLEGKVHGVSRKWFADGRLSFESTYLNGRRHGSTSSWWRNGQKRSIAQYEDGVPHGEHWQWYQNGNKFKRIQLVQGRQEGLQQSWRENGKLYNNYEAKNGRIFGLKRANLCYELSEENIQANN